MGPRRRGPAGLGQLLRSWGRGTASCEVAREAERVVARAAARDRLAAVQAEIALLRADERVPARGRRLRALEQARADLEAELAGPTGPTSPSGWPNRR